MTDIQQDLSEKSESAELLLADPPETGDAEVVDLKTPRPKRKKSRIILLTVIVVLVVLIGGGGVAYATQHDNPDFCNAICHSPMDSYVASYKNGTSINAMQQESTPLLGVTVHKQVGEQSGDEIKCLTCHEADLEEQINEGMHWITGNYTDPLSSLQIVAGEPREGEKNGAEFCLRPECHTGITTTEELALATNVGLRNPHDTPHGKYTNCSGCHQIHEQSSNACAYCHPDAPLPDGWTKPSTSPNFS